MKPLLCAVLALLVLGGSLTSNAAARIVFVGVDVSATAFRGGGNPYDAGWRELLRTIRGGDHAYLALVNERGLANGAPVIDFTIRPFDIWRDKRSAYDAAVEAKLEKQRQALDTIIRATRPSRGTELFGFLHAASQILSPAAPATAKEIVLFSDGLQEGENVNIARSRLSDSDIDHIITIERQAGRLPKLNGMAIWLVYGPSIGPSSPLSTNMLLRIERFWRKYIASCGGDLRSFNSVLVNFGR